MDAKICIHLAEIPNTTPIRNMSNPVSNTRHLLCDLGPPNSGQRNPNLRSVWWFSMPTSSWKNGTVSRRTAASAMISNLRVPSLTKNAMPTMNDRLLRLHAFSRRTYAIRYGWNGVLRPSWNGGSRVLSNMIHKTRPPPCGGLASVHHPSHVA